MVYGVRYMNSIKAPLTGGNLDVVDRCAGATSGHDLGHLFAWLEVQIPRDITISRLVSISRCFDMRFAIFSWEPL